LSRRTTSGITPLLEPVPVAEVEAPGAGPVAEVRATGESARGAVLRMGEGVPGLDMVACCVGCVVLALARAGAAMAGDVA
jgi:hypothetical protein